MITLDEEFKTDEQLKYNLISNEKFQEIWLGFASQMGYMNPFGVNVVEKFESGFTSFPLSRYSKDFVKTTIDTKNDIYILEPSRVLNIQYIEEKNLISPYTIFPKLTFTNFKYTFLPSTFKFGNPTMNSMKSRSITQTNYSNNSNTKYTSMKKLLLTKSTKTNISSSHKIGNSISAEFDFQTDIAGNGWGFNVNISGSHEYNMGNQNEVYESTKIGDWYTLTINPKSKTFLEILAYDSEMTIPFTALAAISFNVNINGRVALIDEHIKDTELIKKLSSKDLTKLNVFDFTFGNDILSANRDIKRHIANRISPDFYTPWNWDLILSKGSSEKVINATTETIAFPFSGFIKRITSDNMLIQQGPSIPLK